MGNKKTYLRKRLLSFKYAFKGILILVKKEPNAKIHLLIACLVILASFIFGITRTEWCIILFAIAMVLAAEGMNSAIEKLTDSVYKEHHKTAGKIKDIAAGSVLICAIIAAIVGTIVFLPYVLKLF